MNLRFDLVLILALCLGVTGGCGNSKPLVPVTGKVSVGGKPAEGALVLFHPEEDNGVTASGVADEDGMYTLITATAGGVAAGKYKVTITWPDPAKVSLEPATMTPVEDPPDLLKGKYANPKTTTLEAVIESDTKELEPFDLK